MRFNHILIIGVGLIGGSFALAARRAKIAGRITGWDNEANLESARARGVIDDVEESLRSDEIIGADLVYLAAPVGAIIDFLRTRGGLLKPGAIVTDAGSTKREICRAARESLPREVLFVGGHPMAGSQKAGVEFASDHLFRGAPYAIIHEAVDEAGAFDAARREALDSIIELVEAIEARPVVLTALRHDELVAMVSHAPQLLATALALACARPGGERALTLAGSGFSDMTRLAESRWSVWEDICRTNSDEIAASLAEVAAQVRRLQAAMSSGDFATVREAFRAANDFMQQLSMRTEGSLD
ncbi:MAG TPA: prephenate dehydrogenase/arogenate dehydrogenase family protein [Blastocatellia bacterium]|jgi:prephenate dehydrogenase